MKLTNIIRDSFINAAMQDVPSVDYKKQAHELFEKAALDAMPAAVARIYKDPKTKGYVNLTYIQFGGFGHYIPSGSSNSLTGSTAVNFLGSKAEELLQLQQAQKAETTKNRELRDSLRSVAYSCTTRKQLLEALPEFEKYLPALMDKTVSLPAVSNVVSAFVKAGWPKDSPKLKKAA